MEDLIKELALALFIGAIIAVGAFITFLVLMWGKTHEPQEPTYPVEYTDKYWL